MEEWLLAWAVYAGPAVADLVDLVDPDPADRLPAADRGGPSGMFGGSSGKKYNLTLTVSTRNLFNTSNYSAPSGDLSSPYFDQYRGLAGFGPFGSSVAYNRKIDLQLRFQF